MPVRLALARARPDVVAVMKSDSFAVSPACMTMVTLRSLFQGCACGIYRKPLAIDHFFENLTP